MRLRVDKPDRLAAIPRFENFRAAAPPQNLRANASLKIMILKNQRAEGR